MGKPIFVLAGQSNAGNIASEMIDALNGKYGVNGYVLVKALHPGAPLTFKNSGKDWVVDDELKKEFVDNTISALDDNPSSKIAGIFWLQGEADTSDVARADEYDDRFNALMEGYRSAVDQATGDRETGISSAMVAISQLSANAPKSDSRSQWDDIIDAQISAAQGSALIDIVNPDALAGIYGFTQATMFKDSLHYSDAFNRYLAESLIEAVEEPGGHMGRRMVYGTSADDTLEGTPGADIMMGGLGNDAYQANAGGDQIVEYKGQGLDQVFAGIDFSLRYHSQHIENLTLTGNRDTKGIGNRQANLITGNDGDNYLNGARGRDVLIGGHGRDTLKGGAGADTFKFNSGDLTGFDGNNRTELDTILDFRVGRDVIQFDSGVAQSLADLKMWVDAEYNQFVIKIVGTDQRLLLQGDYQYSEVYDSGNFLFS